MHPEVPAIAPANGLLACDAVQAAEVHGANALLARVTVQPIETLGDSAVLPAEVPLPLGLALMHVGILNRVVVGGVPLWVHQGSAAGHARAIRTAGTVPGRAAADAPLARPR